MHSSEGREKPDLDAQACGQVRGPARAESRPVSYEITGYNARATVPTLVAFDAAAKAREKNMRRRYPHAYRPVYDPDWKHRPVYDPYWKACRYLTQNLTRFAGLGAYVRALQGASMNGEATTSVFLSRTNRNEKYV